MERRESLGFAVPGELLMKVGNKWCVIPGLGLLAVSLVGIVLSVGTLVTVSSNQEALVEKTIEQYVSMLKFSGLPQEILERFKLEESTDETAQVALDEEQRDLLRQAQRVLGSLRKAVSKAAEQSRNRSKIGLGVCTVAALMGLILTIFGMKRKPRQVEGDAEER